VSAAAILAALREARYAGSAHGVVLSPGEEVDALLARSDDGFGGGGEIGEYLGEISAGLRVCACCVVASDRAEEKDETSRRRPWSCHG
jgi:hypothetical protein